MGVIVAFPRPPLERPIEMFEISDEFPDGHVRTLDRCDGRIHVFADRPGRCQCGGELWKADS